METNGKRPSAGVAERPKQAEDAWRAELPVWTDRMWAALENGVKGGKWFSLMDKVWREKNLRAAYERVRKNQGAAGVDHVTVEEYGRRLDEQIGSLHEGLETGRYRTQALNRIYIDKDGGSGQRPLSIPTVRDRVVHTAARLVIEPIFEKSFAPCSHGFRPGRGCIGALREIAELLKKGYVQIVDADFRKCFDTIPHEPLLRRVGEKIADTRLLDLIRQFLKQGIMETGEVWEPQEGTPQGGPLSPLLANIYLDPLDWEMSEAGFHMIRYADDLLILCRTRQEAGEAMRRLERWTTANGLRLSAEKTRTVDMTPRGASFDFLGYRFYRTTGKGNLICYPRPKSMRKLRHKVRQLTKRCNGHSMACLVRKLNRIFKGWFEYYKYSHANTSRDLDQWVRMRLRSILRKRQRRRGRARGRDHQRWPNAYFRDLGLFSLSAAKASFSSSARR